MALTELRASYQTKLEEQREQLNHLENTETKHFRQEGHGPLHDITAEIKAEYERHIETYAALIAEIDAILGA